MNAGARVSVRRRVRQAFKIQRPEARIRHRAISGMAAGANDAGKIMEIVYRLSGIQKGVLIRHNLNALSLKIFSFF
jgi:hypothetical protein